MLAEEIGRAIAPIPFSSTIYFFAEAILASGSAAQKKSLLPKIAAGRGIDFGELCERLLAGASLKA